MLENLYYVFFSNACLFMQNQVFGAGYPSLPTMTVEEWQHQRFKKQMEQQER
jgi:hypothetical protein